MRQAVHVFGWDDPGTVQAAGGVVTRPGPGGQVELAIVHRPARADWTLPKGKLEAGEEAEVAALREVEEETGYRCDLLEPLGSTHYWDRRGRQKVVRYWQMRVVDGAFRPSAEVNRLRWVTVPEALDQLSYESDRALLRGLNTGH